MRELRGSSGIFVILVLCLVIFPGCVQEGKDKLASKKSEGEVASGSKVKTFAMNVIVSGVPFWSDTRRTWEALSRSRPDVITLYGGPTTSDSQQQINEIDALLNRGIDGLVVAPGDSDALVPIINRAVAMGVPVITYLVDAPRSKRVTYIASELEEASIRVGREVLLPSDEEQQAIVMYGEIGNDEQEARRRGFKMLAEEVPGLNIVASVVDSYDENVGAERLRAVLVQYPKLKYIFGCNSRSAMAAVSVLREQGRERGEIVVTGWDRDQDVLDAILDGWVAASVFQYTEFMTRLAFAILDVQADVQADGVLYPKGGKADGSEARSVPERIILPVQIVTAESAGAF